jgi:hypothetical protein
MRSEPRSSKEMLKLSDDMTVYTSLTLEKSMILSELTTLSTLFVFFVYLFGTYNVFLSFFLT